MDIWWVISLCVMGAIMVVVAIVPPDDDDNDRIEDDDLKLANVANRKPPLNEKS